MRITSITSVPIYELRYRSAAPGGGVANVALPILIATVDALPDGLGGLLLTSDLQGMAPSFRRGGASVLLGEALAELLTDLHTMGLSPPPKDIGVVLAGDLFSAPAADRRGVSGDVRSVWRAFRDEAQWVAGVAGNHDLFGSPIEEKQFASEQGIHLVDGHVAEIGAVRIGGVAGIIGASARPGRRGAREQLAALEAVLDEAPDLVCLHEGPDDPATGGRGNAAIRNVLASRVGGVHAGPLVVCGHVHWPDFLAVLPNGCQVVNVDGRVVIVTAG